MPSSVEQINENRNLFQNLGMELLGYLESKVQLIVLIFI